MNKFTIISLFLAVGVFLSGCQVENSEPVELLRLDLALRDNDFPSDPTVLDAAGHWFEITGMGEVNDSTLEAYNQKTSIASFYPGIDSVWTPARETSLSQELGTAYSLLQKELPTVSLPRPVTVVSPFNQSVILADSMVFIGLNHYLGSDYKFYDYFPDWLRREKNPGRVVPNLVEALIRTSYPGPRSGNMLEQMLYEGAIVELLVRTCGKEALPWDENQISFLKENERQIWEKMLRDKLLYTTDESAVRSLLAPGAVSSVIAPEVPGRAGAYIGWQIVRHRLSNSKVGAEEMLSQEWLTDRNALAEARYQP